MAEEERRKAIPRWKQKRLNGEPLTALEEVQEDADYNYRKRLRDAQEQKEFDEMKQGKLPVEVESNTEIKKGK